MTNSYKIVHDTASNTAGSPGTFSCNDFTPLIFPGASIDDGIIAAAFACQYAVKFSPFPSAIGKTLLMRLFLLRVEAGKSYRVTADGFSPASFDATLTLSSK